MKIIQKGKINPKALENEKEIQPFEDDKKKMLKRMNFFIGYIIEKNPKFKEELFQKLSLKYKSLATKDFLGEELINFPDLENLKDQADLVKNYFNFYLTLLNLPKNVDWHSEKVTVKNGDFLRSFLFTRYYKFQVIDELLGREKAKDFFKNYITAFLIDRQKDQEGSYENITSMYETRIKPSPKVSEWEIYMGLISEGKYFYRNNNCTWIEAMKELPDSELKYYTCCYGDYQSIKTLNKNFILTMEHTIAQGDSYCSRVVHDTRVDWVLTHPPKEFWDTMKASED